MMYEFSGISLRVHQKFPTVASKCVLQISLHFGLHIIFDLQKRTQASVQTEGKFAVRFGMHTHHVIWNAIIESEVELAALLRDVSMKHGYTPQLLRVELAHAIDC